MGNSSSNPKMIRNPAGQLQPQTKEELRTWLEEYCIGTTLNVPKRRLKTLGDVNKEQKKSRARAVKKRGEPNTWDVTLVTDMSELFKNLVYFNAPIDQWDTSQVTNMSNMFMWATSFNQPITMDTSNVTDMLGMFEDASSFNKRSRWTRRK